MTAQPPTTATPLHAASWRLPDHVRSAGRARGLLREQAAGWGVPDGTLETAVLLLSELVTNACRHARTPAGRELRIRCVHQNGALRVEVSDADPALPEPREAAPDDEAGRGLALVAALSERWGARRRACGIGKTVWFVVADEG